MKRVLVTGAGGFIGRHCVPRLIRRGFEVHAVSRRGAPIAASDAHWHACDLLDAEQLAQLMAQVRPEGLIHFAWETTPAEYRTSVENLRWLRASIALVEEFARCGGRRLVVAGTCAEYDWRCGFLSEGITALRPATLYGVCKNRLREAVEALAEAAALSWAWGRIFHLYGPCEAPERLVASVIRELLAGGRARCTSGLQVRDYLAVQDAAEAFAVLFDSDVKGPINVASGQPVSVRGLIRMIGRQLDLVDRIEFGALSCGPEEPPLLVADVRRLCDEVGWRPKWSRAEGLAEAIRWWRESAQVRPG
ncbi:MAG TPA: NAD(P)-dependent oxidoreductase [Candidatus Binataceae bacterium]|jgi:nucleoside-diphosphate-sugar epimerase|nr:NAD(P)-dependent oxidoreductase [Candidatus Binataceae bacterium]